jgi:hypothetical protein
MLKPVARCAVQMMRVLLLLTAIVESRFSRSFGSWSKHRSMEYIVAEFDASLTGIGIRWLLHSMDGSETVVGVAALSLTHLHLKGKPEFQNFCEFLGATCAMREVQQ